MVSNDVGQVGRIPLGGVHDLVQAPHLPGGELHGGSEDVVFVPGPDEGRRGGHQVGGGEGGQQQRVQRLLRVLGGVLGLVPLVDGGQLGQGERGRHHFGHQLVAEGDVISAQLGDLIGTENLYEFAVVLDILSGPLFLVIILHSLESGGGRPLGSNVVS